MFIYIASYLTYFHRSFSKCIFVLFVIITFHPSILLRSKKLIIIAKCYTVVFNSSKKKKKYSLLQHFYVCLLKLWNAL